MFTEKFKNSDAQELADWLFEDREAGFYPTNAKFQKNRNNFLWLKCDGYLKDEEYTLVIDDFTIADLSSTNVMHMGERYREFMTSKFGKEYIDAYHKFVDKKLSKFLPKERNI